jgi:hypothetical protein
VASLSTYPSAKALELFSEAFKKWVIFKRLKKHYTMVREISNDLGNHL